MDCSRGLLGKPGQAAQAEDFLRSALPQVQAEPGTLAWFALRFGRDDYGIFDAFGGEAAREAHLQGPVACALQAQAPQLLQRDAEIARLEILASKLPASPRAWAASAAVCCWPSRPRPATRTRSHSSCARPAPSSWRSPAPPPGSRWRWMDKPHYGIFDVFPDHSGRNAHLTGRVPRELAKHALKLVGGMPSMKMVDVLATHISQSTVEAGLGVDSGARSSSPRTRE